MRMKMLVVAASMPTPAPATSLTPPTRPANLQLRKIPGGYGWPVVGPIWDRLNYFWFQGPENFFRTKVEKYGSTVFRTNVPPSFPFFLGVNPNVIAVLDCQSFSHLFDMELVEKKNVLVGDYMPSVQFTGNMRVCAYLDTAEEQHAKVKNFSMDILKRSSSLWISSLMSSLDTMWNSIDESMDKDGKAKFFVPLQQCLFNFLSQTLIGANPQNYSKELMESGYLMLDKWLALQLLPTVHVGSFQPLVEILLHSFPYPFMLVKGDYEKLVNFIITEGKEVIERGENEFGLSKEETIHNLLFILGFNAFGGFSVFLPTMMKILGKDVGGIQEILRNEVREKSGSRMLSFISIQDMTSVESFVYESLRLNPPVPLQFARARKDFLLKSHDSLFEVQKGELLCGYQKLVMRDPTMFENSETFIAERFIGEKGREMLNFLYWSNGPQTGKPDQSNKQCAAKDLVPLTACLIVAHFFRRYDSLTMDASGTITKLEKAR